MKLSIVTTLYMSAPYINEFYERISSEAKKITDDYEIIFVDDGSPDNSLKKTIKLHESDSKVKVIQLSRNFGHHKAIMTGLSKALGEYIFLIDIDLEEEPELLNQFWAEFNNVGANNVDVVFGVQKSRKGGWFERFSGSCFYKVFNFFSDVSMIENNFLTIRLMKRSYVQELVKFTEKEFYFAPVCSLVGFKQRSLAIKKHSTSPTTYSFLRKYNVLINSVLSFSVKPLYFIFYLGLLLTAISLPFGVFVMIQKMLYPEVSDGWTSLMVSIWFLGGVTIMSLGLIAIYISKIFTETKNRPFVIIKQIWEQD